MAETDNNNLAGGVIDPLKMRNTETSALKRMPVSPNSASASSAARKTIKLKPLVPSSGASDASPSNPGSGSKTIAPPSILLNRKPAAAKTDEPPKFMSTNTAPIGKMVKPGQEKPIQATELTAAPPQTKTVSIPRLQSRLTPNPVGSTEASTPSVTAAATGTVAVPRMNPAASAAAATVAVPKMKKPDPVSIPTTTATVTIQKMKSAPAAPVFISTSTAPIAAAVKPPQSTPISADALGSVSTRTQGIQRQAIDQAKMQSGLQGAKPAIKLRPSASPSQAPTDLTPNSPTVKLSPKTESAVAPVPPPEAAGEAPQAEKSQEVTVTTKIPRKNLQLKPKLSLAGQQNQAQLREQSDIANQKINKAGVEAGEQTIAQQSLEEAEKKAKAQKAKKSADNQEPGLIFTICAILAFLIIGFMVYALTAQFLNTWEQKSLPVIGFQQISESMK
ncbi:MAG: hypothetical protein J5858_07000 [Lentisphaeria bacterium]|nr:hypothetical protein [Lentisphaeria bacterium]